MTIINGCPVSQKVWHAKKTHFSWVISVDIVQILQPFIGNGDVSIWVKNSLRGRKTPNKQTNQQTNQQTNHDFHILDVWKEEIGQNLYKRLACTFKNRSCFGLRHKAFCFRTWSIAVTQNLGFNLIRTICGLLRQVSILSQNFTGIHFWNKHHKNQYTGVSIPGVVVRAYKKNSCFRWTKIFLN